MRVLVAVLLVLAPALCVCKPQLDLVLDEEFDTFNLKLWKHEITLGGGGNWEFEYYSNNRSNSFVKDGVLNIKPTLLADNIGEAGVTATGSLDVWGADPASLCTGNAFFGCSRQAGAGGNDLNPVKSARIRTAESFTFKYGKVEIRAKLPRGDWLWPAIWMLPRYQAYGMWPASGEIDIMESRGNAPSYTPGGCDVFGSTLHWGPGYTEDKWPLTHKTMKPGVDLSADFHTYGLVWNESYIGTYFDHESNTVLAFRLTTPFWQLGGWDSSHWNNPWDGAGKDAPFDQEFYLLINLAVGGTGGYFPDGFGKPYSNGDPHAINSFWNAHGQWYPTWTSPFQIDSVKVWSTKTEN